MTITTGNRQTGSALFLSLVFLLLLTLLGVTAMESGTLEEKMAGNSRSRNVAFQAAESALRDAEWLIRRGAGVSEVDFLDRFSDTCDGGLCATDNPQDTFAGGFWAGADWAGGSGLRELGDNRAELDNAGELTPALELIVPGDLPGVAQQPDYLIEANRGLYAGLPDASYLYRITARGYGNDSADQTAPRSRATLQEIYRPAR